MKKKRLISFALLAILAVGSIPMLAPFGWMLSTSLKTKELAGEHPPRWIPEKETAFLLTDGRREPVTVLTETADERLKIRTEQGETLFVPIDRVQRERRVAMHWENYQRVFQPSAAHQDEDFPRYLLNTLLIAILTAMGQALSSSLVAFGFARLRFWGNGPLFAVMLATMMIPGQIGMIPTFMIFRWLGWIDTFLPLIIPAWLGSAFFAFLYRQYFMSIPLEMDEAAKVDGATPLQIYWHVLLPMAKPVTVTVGVFSFLGAWNEFLGPLIYLNSDHKRTLSLALAKFQSAYGADVPALMAAATLMLLPALAIYFFSQRALTEGLNIGGVKG